MKNYYNSIQSEILNTKKWSKLVIIISILEIILNVLVIIFAIVSVATAVHAAFDGAVFSAIAGIVGIGAAIIVFLVLLIVLTITKLIFSILLIVELKKVEGKLSAAPILIIVGLSLGLISIILSFVVPFIGFLGLMGFVLVLVGAIMAKNIANSISYATIKKNTEEII
ncbi:hypothetical protein [Mycoplasmopsis cricetuli]|uniref:hypothetical protein n=1 Tax=Mycoplasmopsis cricetuli TaxID=171283 RepID=UPI00047006D2|nr:hypothetical protein [Mycoplasmopsis cricetuli]